MVCRSSDFCGMELAGHGWFQWIPPVTKARRASRTRAPIFAILRSSVKGRFELLPLYTTKRFKHLVQSTRLGFLLSGSRCPLSAPLPCNAPLLLLAGTGRAGRFVPVYKDGTYLALTLGGTILEKAISMPRVGSSNIHAGQDVSSKVCASHQRKQELCRSKRLSKMRAGQNRQATSMPGKSFQARCLPTLTA